MAEPTDEDDAPPTPHDAIFKVVYGEPAHAAVVLRAAFPAPLAAGLDWDALESRPTVLVGAGGRQGSRDLRFRAPLRSAHAGAGAPFEVGVDLLFEHASVPEPRQRLRLNGYLQHGWEAADRRPGPRRPLPVILPAVLHQGPGAWTIPELVDLHELPPDLRAHVAPFTPRFDVAQLDLGRWTEEGLRALPPGLARLGLAVLKAARRDDEDLIDLFARWRDDVRGACAAGPSRTLAELVSYTAWVRGERADPEYFDKVRRAVDPADREAFMGGFMLFGDRMREEGREEQSRRLLERQLRRRFPGVTAERLARLEGASLEELERWAERVVVAATPDEVFSDPPP